MWGNTPYVSILCVLGASVLGAGGQYLFKLGTDQTTGGSLSFLKSPWVWVGMGFYLLVMALFSYAFRRGGTVTVLYPIYASTFIWAAVMGWLFYCQPIRPIHLLGMLLLVAGMALMGIGHSSPAD